MKVTLTISDRDLGTLLRALDTVVAEYAGTNLFTRIRAIRKDLAAQRKSPPAPTVVQSAVDRLVERVRKAYPNG